MDRVCGVADTETGYANGAGATPTYESVRANSGHAETVRVVFDKGVVSLEEGWLFLPSDGGNGASAIPGARPFAGRARRAKGMARQATEAALGVPAASKEPVP